MDPLQILFLSAEVSPFAKRGGLGDVAGSLPKAIKERGHDIRVVMPAYQVIEEGFEGVEPMDLTLNVPMGIGMIRCGVFRGTLPGSDVPIYFIANQPLFNRAEVYGYDDDPYRFSLFSRAALDLAVGALGWRPDVVHANDWHTAPAITWLATAGRGDPRYQDIPTLYTIHNLAHQGRTSWHIMDYLGIQSYSLREEDYGAVNFMARGIHHATMINTVSPTYALEIMTSEGGAYMDDLLRQRSYDVHGILNGIDYDEWDPAEDPRLAANFSADKREDRIENKRALQKYLGLPQRDGVPVVAMISRLDWQKGLDITGPAIDMLLSGYAGEAQFVVLGTGAQQYENMFANLARRHRERMTAVLEYNADLAPLIYGASDMFIMPSRFEPCGLGQMLAMRYGSIPIVHATGGLADTVSEPQNGFTYHQHDVRDFWHALQRAMYTYTSEPEQWSKMQHRGMTADYSWERSAGGYEQLYEWAVARAQSLQS